MTHSLDSPTPEFNPSDGPPRLDFDENSTSPGDSSDIEAIDENAVDSALTSADPSIVLETSGPAESTAQPASKPRRWLRRLASAAILYHCLAIFFAPAAVEPSSGLMRSGWRLFRPYLQFFYLNHGYHFFAPEPSYSTLVGYTMEFPDGKTETGRFPHRGISPRLLYHRHFMMSEFLGFVPDDEEQPWHRSYARHLCKTYGATRVSLSRITHYLPTPQAVLDGRGLNDPESFAEVPLGSFSCDEF